uniref:Uncharacterized protein n=1 Tax=Odontella aurita TaxID=265563 RepID=A0A7S4IXD2_9STRA
MRPRRTICARERRLRSLRYSRRTEFQFSARRAGSMGSKTAPLYTVRWWYRDSKSPVRSFGAGAKKSVPKFHGGGGRTASAPLPALSALPVVSLSLLPLQNFDVRGGTSTQKAIRRLCAAKFSIISAAPRKATDKLSAASAYVQRRP